jgi:hypothetical protein
VSIAAVAIWHQSASSRTTCAGRKRFVPKVIDRRSFSSVHFGSPWSSRENFAFVSHSLNDLFITPNIAASAQDETFLLHRTTVVKVGIVSSVWIAHAFVFILCRVPNFVEVLGSKVDGVEAYR